MQSATSTYWRLSSFYFWYYAAIGGFTPYFAQWLHDSGVGAIAISLLMATWYATRIAAPTVWSAATTRSPNPMRWLRAGALITLVAFSGFLSGNHIALLFAVMLVFSFFFNAIMPQFEALTLDTLDARRSEYGRIRVWGSVGFIVVTLGYGWVLEHGGTHLLPAIMLPLFGATVITAFVNRMPSSHVHATEHPAPTLLSMLRRPGVVTFLTVALLMQISFGPFYVFYTLHLGEAGYGTTTIGVLWAIGVLAEIVLFVFAPRLLRAFTPTTLVLACLAVTALRWAVTALFADSLLLMALAQLTHALSFGVFHACCMQMVAVFFPGRGSGHGQALLYALGSGLGGVIGSVLAGAAWKLGGGQAAFLLGAAGAVLGFLVALRLRVPESPVVAVPPVLTAPADA